MFDRERIVSAVKSQMPEKRWHHTLGVVKSAVELAGRYGADAEKAELAAYLHDYAKYWPAETQKQVVVEQRMPQELLDYGPELWHAPVGAYAVERDLGIRDPEILDAIRYHTSGREGMTLLDKIVCLADYIEPGRQFPGVEEIRGLAKESLELALIAGFDSTIRYLVEQRKPVFPLTVMARNSLIREYDAKQRGGDRNE
mgnify:CR=1 FL=1